jgi:Molecular chaperone GrpE (heat shock protein)
MSELNINENSLQGKYDKISIPSLYDFILSQEKLAMEIRKQNKELHNLSTQIERNHHSIEDLFSSLESPEVEEKIDQEPKENNLSSEISALMQAMDLFFHLFQAEMLNSEQLLKIIPDSCSFWSRKKPKWRLTFEETVKGYSSGVQMIQEKFSQLLENVGIQLIAPELGDPFEAANHRVVERCFGEEAYTIAKLVRLGYEKNHVILRPAEVIIYCKDVYEI